MRSIACCAVLVALLAGPAGAQSAPSDFGSYVVFGGMRIKIAHDVVVQGGGVASNAVLSAARAADLQNFAAANRIVLHSGAVVEGDAYTNLLTGVGTVLGSTVSPLALPVLT